MLKTFSIGRFQEGGSLLHRADPRSKLISVLLLIVALFMIKSPLSFLLLTGVAVATLMACRCAIRDILRGLKPILLLALIASLSNLLFSGGEPLQQSGILHHISREGIFATVEMLARLVALCLGTMIVTATTSPASLMEGGARLMQPLQRLGVPVTEITLVLSLAFNYIPMVAETAQTLASTYLARTVRVHRGRMFRKARVCARLLAPLVLALFKKGDELVKHCQTKGADGSGVPGNLQPRGFSRADALLACCMVICFGTLLYIETVIQ